MQKAVLLHEIGTEWKRNINFPGRHMGQLGAEQLHERLLGKTGSHTLGSVAHFSTGAPMSFQARQPPAIDVTFV